MSRRKRKKELTAYSAGQKAINFLSSNPEKNYSLKQISRKIHFFNKSSRKLLLEGIENLIQENKLVIHKDGSYQYNTERKIERRVERFSKQKNVKQNPFEEEKHKEKPNQESVIEHIGTIDFVNAGFAYVVSDDFEEDVKIKTSLLKGALDGDLSLIHI